MAEWARAVNTTIKDYLKGSEPAVMRNRKITALLKDRGRITFNAKGLSLDWRVQYKQIPLSGYADGDTQTFARHDRWKEAELDWRGYASGDSMTKKERLMNRSTAQIIDLYSEIATLLMEDVKQQFSPEFYVDGNAAGNEKRLHGIESFLGDDGTPSTGAPIADASDTYAGLSTALGNYGGAWSGTWPNGQGDAHYDFFSPLLVDFTSAVSVANSGWSSSTKTWPNTCEEALAFAILYTQKNRGMDDQIDLFFLDTLLYGQYKNAMRAKERVLVQRNGQESGLVKLGFHDVLNQDGVDITSEYGIPASTGYGFNIDQMELRSMQGQLFVAEGPDYDIGSKSWRLSVDFFGNLRFKTPRNFCKLKAYS